MKTCTLIIASMLLLLFSCKSHKDVSRSVTNQTRGESLVTVNDSSKTHLETSVDNIIEAKEESNTYTIRTEFGPDNHVVSKTETWNNINFKVDIKSSLNDIKREDFKYNSATQITDTTSQIINEVVKETKDSRPLQGIEIFYAVTAGFLGIGIIIVIARKLF